MKLPNADLEAADGVYEMEIMEVDVSSIEQDHMERVKGEDSQMYYRLNYEIVVSLLSGQTKYAFRHKDKIYAVKKIDCT